MKNKPYGRKKGYTLAEILVTLLVMSIFFLIISISFQATSTVIKTEQYVHQKLASQEKFQVLFGIMEDTLKWSGSMNTFLSKMDTFKEINSDNGISIDASGTRMTVQTAIVESLILKKIESDQATNVFLPLSKSKFENRNYKALFTEALLDYMMTGTDPATVINITAMPSPTTLTDVGTETRITVTPTPPASMNYCFLIRDRNTDGDILKFEAISDRPSFTDEGYQIFINKFYLDRTEGEETGKIVMETWKPGFTYSPTVILLENVKDFKLATTTTLESIHATVTVKIPSNKSGNYFEITKIRDFWIPDD